VRSVTTEELKSLVAAHPFRSQGYTFDVPVLPALLSPPTPARGLSHNAPGHGEDDF